MGTPSGYGDDYIFCNDCAPKAKIHFEIAACHDGGMVSAPDCEGDDDKIPHTCRFSKEQLIAAREAFKRYG
jgi:hypothetical protein